MRPLPLALLATTLACAPASDELDQPAADAIARELAAEVTGEGPFRLMRAGRFRAGTPITEPGPTDDGEPSDTILPEDDGFLFFLDLAPRTFFAHPTRWILVEDDGETTEKDSQWWPEVDGRVPAALQDEPADDDPDVLELDLQLAPSAGVRPVYRIPRLDLQESNAYLVVQGLRTTESLHDDATLTGENGLAFFEAWQDALSETVYLAEDDADTAFTTLDALAEDHDVVTFAAIAHGGEDTIRLGGTWYAVSALTSVIAAHPDTTFNILLGSCHSGSFVDELDGYDNVHAVLTAVAADEGATPDWDTWTGGPAIADINPPDIGSEWFSSLYDAARVLTASSDAFAPVRQAAYDAGVPTSTALLCFAALGATGDLPDHGLGSDLDLSHVVGGHTPQRWCPGL